MAICMALYVYARTCYTPAHCVYIYVHIQITQFYGFKKVLYLFLDMVLMLLLCVSVVSLEAVEESESRFKDENDLFIKSDVMKWWSRNNDAKGIACKQITNSSSKLLHL